MQLRAFRPRQLYYLQKQEKTAKAKATNKMHNKVIKIDDNNLKWTEYSWLQWTFYC